MCNAFLYAGFTRLMYLLGTHRTAIGGYRGMQLDQKCCVFSLAIVSSCVCKCHWKCMRKTWERRSMTQLINFKVLPMLVTLLNLACLFKNFASLLWHSLWAKDYWYSLRGVLCLMQGYQPRWVKVNITVYRGPSSCQCLTRCAFISMKMLASYPGLPMFFNVHEKNQALLIFMI